MWRKYWSEVRWLFFYSAFAMLALTLFVLGDPAQVYRTTRPDLAFVLYNGQSLQIILPTVMVVCSVLLGVGGLGHERSAGTALFTLSLPFTRRSLVTGRFVAGAGAVMLLAIGTTSTVSVWAAVHGLGSQFPLSRALGLACCLAAGSLSVYAFSFLAANVTAHTVRTVATVATLLVVLLIGAGAPNQVHELHSIGWWLAPINFFRLMGGANYLFRGAMPWAGVAIGVGITIGLAEVTIRWVERFDF